MKRNKFYITTPLYYVNSKPHIGTLYTTVLSDVAARWQELMGKKVFFLTGTDEHGQKIFEKALSVGSNPKQFVDTIVPEFNRVWSLFNINYTKFIRTTDKEHEQAVIYWIKKLQEQGDIYKSIYTGLYCVPCETYVTVTSESIRDASGEVLCPSCQRKVQEVSEESYFFRLSAYQDQLLEFYNKNPDFITPKERLNEIISFVKSGLRDLSISRKSVSWGIPFPGDPSHTIYVWADALNNYISAIGYGQQKTAEDEQFAFWWPADVQTMAKDIVRFHAIYWPAFLLAAGLELPKKLLAHGYILVGDRKMSKSLGNTIDPEQLAQWYGVDQVRYYLMRHFSIAQDGQFDLKDIEEHITADLANGVGNLLSRTVALALNNKCERISPPVLLEPASEALREKCKETFKFYWEEMNKCSFHLALSELWKFISLVNAHFHTMQPWVLAKTNHELFLETLSVTCHSLYAIGHMLWPVMPDKMEVLLNTIGTPLNKNINHEPGLRESIWNKDFNLKPVDAPLFIRPPVLYSQENQGTQETGETKKVKQEKKQEKHEPQELQTITIDTFAQVGLYVGTVLSCEKVPGSDKLYKLMVDFGPLGQRQILSGVAQALTPDQLINKQGIFVVNLAPRTLMGLESQGMMLFAHDKQGVWQIATVSGSVQNGTRIG